MGCLYQIEFPNGKSYIGITSKTAWRRFKTHCSDARRADDDRALQRAIRKHGEAAASVRTLVIADDWKYLCFLERKAITAYETKLPNGYNTTDGGDGVLGRSASPHQRAAVSTALKGRVRSPEHCLRISLAKTGSKHTEETKAKIGAASRGHVLSAEAREKVAASKRGKPRSESTKQKLRIANLGKGARHGL